MNPFRPPFGVPSRPRNQTSHRPNTTQPQPSFNFQEMNPSMLAYAQILGMIPATVLSRSTRLCIHRRFATVSRRNRARR
ncbi:hypothetical protein HanPI659440_Chr08g0302771 [Helianthus annuus]|nr:hypothetical protein HanPI659440_Chr08g0302771 [Helianthus annuus]